MDRRGEGARRPGRASEINCGEVGETGLLPDDDVADTSPDIPARPALSHLLGLRLETSIRHQRS